MVQRRPWASQSRAGLAGAIAALLAATLVRPARADERLRFAWSAPPECPDRPAVVRRIDALVGGVDVPPDLSFDADVLPADGGRWRIVLKSGWTGGTTERRFESASCSSLAAATALIVAMSIDPAAVADRATTAAGFREPPTPDEADRVSRGAGDKSRLHLAIGPRTTGDLGSLPAPTLAAGGGVAFEWSTLRFEASALAWLPRRTSSDPSAVAGEIGLVTGEARGCAQLIGGAAHFDACLGAEAGSTTGRGTGFPQATQAHGLWLAALAGVALRPSSRDLLGAWIGFDVGVPLVVPTYVIEGLGEVHRPWPVLVRASMGMDFRLF